MVLPSFSRPWSIVCLALLPTVSACEQPGSAGPASREQNTESAPAAAQATPADRHLSGRHAVQCGCTLESVGHCGEYVEVEGQFVELQLPESTDLGPMPFCGKEGLEATLEGDLKNGKVIATSFQLSE